MMKDYFFKDGIKINFYPDFIIKTKNGNYILTEYKGEYLVTNDDTKYKKELGEKWEEMTPSNYTFELVDKHVIDEFIIKLKNIIKKLSEWICRFSKSMYNIIFMKSHFLIKFSYRIIYLK